METRYNTHMDKLHKVFDERPWGNFQQFTLNEPSTVKVITVKKGEAFSLQRHANRSEFWHILSGNGIATIGEATQEVKTGDEVFIESGVGHRMEATEDIVFLEIAFGEFDESDIVRIEDKYNRS